MNTTAPENPPVNSPPAEAVSDASSPSRRIDTLIFVVNFSVTILLLFSCLGAIFGGDPYDSVSGAIMLLPVVGYAIAEWCCWYRRWQWLTPVLGGLNLAGAALLAFGLITGLAGVATAKNPVSTSVLIVVVLVCGLPAIYSGLTGWRRLWPVFQRRSSAT